MELDKEKGPIYSRYDRDQPENYSPIVDYAAPPRTTDEIQFMLAHKITPNQADPNDMRPSTSQTYRATPPTFLQALNASMAQRTAGQSVDGQNKTDQASYWPGQRRNTKRTPAQNRAALVGVIIWFIFIVASMLMSLFRK
ncbi:MAG TPA: hypothetical protein VFB98_03605 [Candidatus Deferrimicrobium sp.]|nr:hypothetical protein [Candidatus Deferrimicrobium sp.]